MIEVDAPSAELRQAADAAVSAAGLDGHLAIELVGEERIRELNSEHRGKDEPTDVLSFPVDEAGLSAGAVYGYARVLDGGTGSVTLFFERVSPGSQ